MRLPVVASVLVFTFAAGAACTSSTPTDPGSKDSKSKSSSSSGDDDDDTGSGGGTDKGLTGEGDPSDAPDVNPNGAKYPTTNIGTKASTHNADKVTVGKPGNVIENFKFLGYPDGDPEKGLQPISLASFYDPDGKLGVKLIHIQAAGVWCYWCKQETDATTKVADALKEKGVVFITSVAEGRSQGVAATQGDLDVWVAQFKPTYPQVLDSGNKQFGIFYDAAALPWNANIDPRTMEILSSGTGAPSTDGKTVTSDTIQKEADKWLAFLKTYDAKPN